MILVLLLLIPAIAVALISTTRKRVVAELIHTSASILTLAAGAVAIADVWLGQSAVSWNLFRADSLSAFMIAIVVFVAAVAGIYAVGYMRLEFGDDHFPRVRLFYALFHS